MEADRDVTAWVVLPEERKGFSWVSQVHTTFRLIYWVEKVLADPVLKLCASIRLVGFNSFKSVAFPGMTVVFIVTLTGFRITWEPHLERHVWECDFE